MKVDDLHNFLKLLMFINASVPLLFDEVVRGFGHKKNC